MTPAQCVEDLGWVRHNVWHAHYVNTASRCLHAPAPTSLNVLFPICVSGIAPVRKMCDASVNVALGVVAQCPISNMRLGHCASAEDVRCER